MSTMTPGVRKALIAGGIAVVLSGGGAATVWAASQIIPSYLGAVAAGTASPTPAPTSSATPSPGPTPPGTPSHGHGRHFPGLAHGFAGMGIHGEFTVKNNDGTYTTIVTQTGTVQSAGDSNVTVKSDDGFTQSYAIASSTSIVRIPGPESATQGRKFPLEAIKASDLKAGDTVRVSGTKSGTTVTASHIIAGTWPAGVDKAMPNNTAPGDHGRHHPGNKA
ncbi:hypothetical protein [Arthrobacter celericrescens]|uniref:hypothetical protein n=1 Tax=Arthrobacter celericrescens TaxID=2320851 RepID=UPI001969809F|nr:hypothetical protein [Arthrobacter celericrescens]